MKYRKKPVSQGFFDDMDAAADHTRQLKQNNPPLVYNITTQKIKNNLNIILTIDDYNQLRYPDNGKDSKLDDIIQKHIERLIEDIADYNTRITKKI